MYTGTAIRRRVVVFSYVEELWGVNTRELGFDFVGIPGAREDRKILRSAAIRVRVCFVCEQRLQLVS